MGQSRPQARHWIPQNPQHPTIGETETETEEIATGTLHGVRQYISLVVLPTETAIDVIVTEIEGTGTATTGV